MAALAAMALLPLAGCVDTPIIGDDIRVVRDSPGYLREAYVYSHKDPAADAADSFRVGNYRLYALISFGEHYPGCRPGVGEKYARRYGTTLLPKTAGAIDTDAQEYYRDKAWNYAATYNHEMMALLGTLDAHGRSTEHAVLDK